jgi:tetratricopeptide (TPR) repeat protein
MVFCGTTASLCSWVAELPLEHETVLADLLIRYEQQLEGEGYPDPDVLSEAETVLHLRLQEVQLDQELVHLADALYGHLQRYESLYELLSRYREQDLPPYEQAWAWWRMNDCLALQRRCQELIAQQRLLLQWGLATLPAEHCLALLNDATQALCWLRGQQQDDWFGLCTDLLTRVQPGDQNREDRFLLMRTALLMTMKTQGATRVEQAHGWLAALYHLVQEAPGCELTDELLLETQAIHLEALEALQESASVRQVGEAAAQHLWARISHLSQLSLAQRRNLRRLCHNLGASLYATRQYDLAIPFLQQAIAYGSTTPRSYLWLAACLWATTRDQGKVLALLSQAQAHDASGSMLQQMHLLPEFKEMHLDPQFE